VSPSAWRVSKNLAFQTLHVFKRDVEEVARAARGIEDAGGAELAVKGARGFDCRIPVAGIDLFGDNRLAAAPVVPEWLYEGWNDEPLYIGARRVVGSERMAFIGIECAFKQRTEDGRFDISPARVGGFNEQAELITGERQGFGGFE
jgi:hypothetical protein